MDGRKNKEVIIIIVSVVVIILVVYLVISPVISILKKSNYTIATKGEDLKRSEENLENLKNLKQTMASKTGEVKALLSALPASVDSEDLMATLEAMANRNGMQLAGVTPLDAEQEELGEASINGTGLGTASFDIVVRGSYQGLQKFLGDLEANRRPISANKIAISKETAGAGGTTLNTTLSLITYYSQIK